jgi:peptidoglycan/xylan/chitin deacetylase (PgdA/CDA1 family)
MTWDQVRALSADGFEIGCHTASHIDMGSASADAVRQDLSVSITRLKAELVQSTPLFAYPFGGRNNISDATRAVVKELGFSCCTSCHGGTNASAADPFHLNRVPIAEWFATPHQFGYELLAGRLEALQSPS